MFRRLFFISVLAWLTWGCGAQPQAPTTPALPVTIQAGEGVEQVSLGETKADIEQRLGEPEERDINEFAPSSSYSLYHSKGLELVFADDVLEMIVCHPSDQEWTGYGGATKEGLSVHSTRENVVAALGTPAEESPQSLNYESQGIWFRFTPEGTVEALCVLPVKE